MAPPPSPAPPTAGAPLHPPGRPPAGGGARGTPAAPRCAPLPPPRRGGRGLICGRTFTSPEGRHGAPGRTVLPWFLIQRVVVERQVRDAVSGGGKLSPLPLLCLLLPGPKQLTTFQPRPAALPDRVFSCGEDSCSPSILLLLLSRAQRRWDSASFSSRPQGDFTVHSPG